MEDDDRHYLHEFMTSQRTVRKPNKWINGSIWLSILLLLGCLAYLLVHG